MGGLNGTVRGADGKPVRDAHIDLRNLANGQITASGYTTYNGSFEFTNIPNGSYEVVVTNGLEYGARTPRVSVAPTTNASSPAKSSRPGPSEVMFPAATTGTTPAAHASWRAPG